MKGYSVPSLRRVNSEQAHFVASAFAAAPCVASDPKVGVAYAELRDQARSWFARLTTDQANPQSSQVLGSLNRGLLKHPAYYLFPDPSEAAVLTDEPELARSAPGPVLIGPAP